LAALGSRKLSKRWKMESLYDMVAAQQGPWKAERSKRGDTIVVRTGLN